MTEPTIICPKCHAEIPLTESLVAPLVEATREKFEKQLQEERAKVEEREGAVRSQLSALEGQRQKLNDEIEIRLASERTKISEEEAKKARVVLQGDLTERSEQIRTLQEALQERDTKLGEARKQQAELLRQQRDLAEAQDAMELTIEQRVNQSLGDVKERAKKEAEDGLILRVREKEEQISSMQRQIEDLKRKAEQGSQQLQGEVFELELESLLGQQFPMDVIEPVAKGELGADVVHRVNLRDGTLAGTILWEIKRTRNWSDGWLGKLRADQRAAGADVALIVTHALPKGIENFDLRDGIWIAAPQCALPVAVALREMLIGVAAARKTGEGQLTKVEMVYEYLTGPRFRHRVRGNRRAILRNAGRPGAGAADNDQSVGQTGTADQVRTRKHGRHARRSPRNCRAQHPRNRRTELQPSGGSR